jgi:hypothetical protein
MKKTLMFAGLLALTGALSSCLSTGLVTFSDLKFDSNYTAQINGVNRFVVCDDRQTAITFSFVVDGTTYLDRFNAVFIGKTQGTRVPIGSYTVSQGTYNGNRLSLTTNFSAGSAPRVTPTPRAVIVVPTPTILGYTDLELTIFDTKGGSVSGLISQNSSSDPIPVVSNCPAN